MKRTSKVAEANLPRDLIGRPADPAMLEVLDLYRKTKALCARKDLPPFAARNLRASLAAGWCVEDDSLDVDAEVRLFPWRAAATIEGVLCGYKIGLRLQAAGKNRL